MTRIRHIDRDLKGDPSAGPIADLAALDDLRGYVVRTQVLGGSKRAEKAFVDSQVNAAFDAQLANGSWDNTIVDTAGRMMRLMTLGVSPRNRALRKGRKWLLAQQVSDGSIWQDLFREPTATDRGQLGDRYRAYHPHIAPKFCCGVNHATAACCVMECLFEMGDDVSSTPQLAAALNRILALGNVHGGICGVGFEWDDPNAVKPYPKDGLWNRRDNQVFRRAAEENPGVTICAHYLMRAVAHSRELAESPLVKSAFGIWRNRQLDNGSFDTNYYQYDFYYALDTLSLYADHPEARDMLINTLPAILRRQKRDGRWWRRDNWAAPTFSAVWAMHRAGVLG